MEWRQSCTALSIAIITLPTTSISLIHVHRINLLQLMLMKWGTHLLKRLWKLCEVINLMRCPFTWFFPSLQEMQIQRVCVYNAMDITENWWSGIMINLKCYYDKKNLLLFFLQILLPCLFDTSLAKSYALNFMQRLFSLSASLGFHSLPLFKFRTDQMDFRMQCVCTQQGWYAATFGL